MRDASNEIDAAHDVAKLIAAAELYCACISAIQMQEVIRLQDHVTELGVADALLAAPESRCNGVARDHLIHGKVLADIAQHVEETHIREPIDVVAHHGGTRTRKVKKPLEDAALLRNVVLDELAREQLTLSALSTRITDESRTAARDDDRSMSCALQVRKQLDSHEVANSQTIGGRIKPCVARTHSTREMRSQLRRCRLMQQPTPLKFIEKWKHVQISRVA